MDIIILLLPVLFGSALSQVLRGSRICQEGAPLSNFNCGRGGRRCPSGYTCEIAPNDAYAVCCRNPGTSGYRACPPPTGPGVCASNCQQGRFDHCRRSGRLCCRNGCGAYQCTRPTRPSPGIPPWCPEGSPRIRCFVNPCSIMTCPRFPFARCLPTNPCEPACTGAFYLWGRRRIPDWQCNRRIGRRGRRDEVDGFRPL